MFVISVAAELAGMHPQTLRQYDRLGLVTPGRTAGRGRRYSARDVALLREVQRLSQEEGVNLAGIKRILELEHQVGALRERVEQLLAELGEARERLRSVPRVFAAGAGGRHRGGGPAAAAAARAVRQRAGGLAADPPPLALHDRSFQGSGDPMRGSPLPWERRS